MSPHANIQVFEDPINVTLPTTSVRMVVVQPFLEFAQPRQEPFPLSESCLARLLSGVGTAIEVSRAIQPHFIVFPEFSLPGLPGIELVMEALQSGMFPGPVIVIAGIRGLSREEYSNVCTLSGADIHVDDCNAPTAVGALEWVNASITFVKDDEGHLSLWIQVKLSPSSPEATTPHQAMFAGSAVRIFRARFDNGVPCRFLSLLCFDWIGCESGAPVPRSVLTHFNEQCTALGSPQSLHWVFVLQHNSSPNHHTFLTTANEFLSHPTEYPYVERHDAAVVMACTASSTVPARGGSYGFSSLIFGPRAPFDTGRCLPTFSTKYSRQRASDALGTCKDFVLREMGECTHVIDVRIPTYVIPDATDRTPALIRAEVYPFHGTVDDPRIPGGPVSPVVKWVNDELDDIPDLANEYFDGTALESLIQNAHDAAIGCYRRVLSQDLAVRVSVATANPSQDQSSDYDPGIKADDWNDAERRGLRHVMQTLTLIGSVATIDATISRLHARHSSNGVEIAAICGTSHTECLATFNTWAQRTHSPILLVTRDANNVSHLPRELETFADPRGAVGIRVTDAHTLLHNARSSTEDEYRAFITDLIDAPDRRFI